MTDEAKTEKDFPILTKSYHVTMGDGSVWAIPVADIAMNRAEHYMGEYGDDLVFSLYEDTLPLFQETPSEIADWACNNMDWKDVASVAVRIESPDAATRYAKDWTNPTKTEIK
jgi:hypothetical protein